MFERMFKPVHALEYWWQVSERCLRPQECWLWTKLQMANKRLDLASKARLLKSITTDNQTALSRGSQQRSGNALVWSLRPKLNPQTELLKHNSPANAPNYFRGEINMCITSWSGATFLYQSVPRHINASVITRQDKPNLYPHLPKRPDAGNWSKLNVTIYSCQEIQNQMTEILRRHA